MIIEIGNIWTIEADVRVVPTNLGWTKRGHNVMGRGVAKQASQLYPELAQLYGEFCRAIAKHPYDRVPLFQYNELVMFPVKPLNRQYPWLSWKQPADINLIESSAVVLARTFLNDRIVLPLVGCGNGGLDPKDVLPVLEKHLAADRFILVLLPNDRCVTEVLQ